MTRTTAKLEELRTVVRDVGNRPVLVLCHNNPDPDTIASAFAFSHLLTTKLGVKCIMGYGGMVTRAENKAMIQRLQINLRSLSAIEHSEYYGVALIDAQPATGNNLWVTKNEAPLIVIDHHPLRKLSLKADFHDVRKGYGATSTIMTEYFIASGIIPPKRVANALLYGIKSDTNSLLRGVSIQLSFTLDESSGCGRHRTSLTLRGVFQGLFQRSVRFRHL
jgi:nanoRNase/pAp phosphatase (c-di-AMP/oligoRNAs hydrolase)